MYLIKPIWRASDLNSNPSPIQKIIMRNNLKLILLIALVVSFFFACKKDEQVNISSPVFVASQPVKPGNIQGTIKGTLQSDSIYWVIGDVTINKGDTLTAQPGAKIYFTGNYNFFIHGNLVSVGTQAKPVWFTAAPNRTLLAKKDVAGQDPTTDPAYQGSWGGLLGDTTTQFMIFKWTHIEFGGGKVGTSSVYGIKNASTAYMISFVNPSGYLILEDSWLYGGVDDPIRIQGGRIHIMRNTSEKGGYTGGEGIANIKAGTVGNVAYNLIIGPNTNGVKPSNNGGRNPQTNIIAYNNTILNGGYRRLRVGNSLGRGGSINYEEGSEGLCYNNLLVNCLFGLRIVGTANYLGNALIVADTAHLFYGNNFNYGDSLSICNQFYPVNFLTKPQATDMPTPSSYLPANYTLGAVYDGSSLVQKNNPQFVYYPLPQASGTLADISFATGWDFRLKPTSPCIGKGNINFSPLNVVPIDPVYGATEITLPGADIGCYQLNGIGNKH